MSRLCLSYVILGILGPCGIADACDAFAKSGMAGMPMAGFGGKAMPVAGGGLYVPPKYAQKAMMAKMARLAAGVDQPQLAKSRKTRFGGVDSTAVAKQTPLRFDGAALKRSEIAELKAASDQATLARVSDPKLGGRDRK